MSTVATIESPLYVPERLYRRNREMFRYTLDAQDCLSNAHTIHPVLMVHKHIGVSLLVHSSDTNGLAV